jgi:DNA repair protein RadC
MPDYELLELFLFRSIPQKDVKPVAKALLDRFGSLSGVLTASVDDIAAVKPACLNPRTGRTERRGTGAAGALDLKLMHEATQRIHKAQLQQGPVISSWTSLLDYVRTRFAGDKREQFHALFLDTRNRLMRDETLNRGTIDHAPAYPREIATRALELGASAVILVHNHPRAIRRRPARTSRPRGRSSRPAARSRSPSTTTSSSVAKASPASRRSA